MEGLLWFDELKTQSLVQMLREARARFKRKYPGHAPSVCFVNPVTLGDKTEAAGLDLRPLPTVLRNHYWLVELAIQEVTPEAEPDPEPTITWTDWRETFGMEEAP